MKHWKLSLKARPPNTEKMCFACKPNHDFVHFIVVQTQLCTHGEKKSKWINYAYPQIFLEKIFYCSSGIQGKKNNLHVSRVCADNFHISEKRPSPGLMQGLHYSQTEGLCLFLSWVWKLLKKYRFQGAGGQWKVGTKAETISWIYWDSF